MFMANRFAEKPNAEIMLLAAAAIEHLLKFSSIGKNPRWREQKEFDLDLAEEIRARVKRWRENNGR